MKEEIKKWINQAERDLKSAGKSFLIEEYSWSGFQIQQAIEKALKSLILKEKKELIRTHDLIFLGKRVEIPKEFLDIFRKINNLYLSNRYPDVSKVKLNKKEIEEYLKIAKEVLKWVKKKI